VALCADTAVESTAQVGARDDSAGPTAAMTATAAAAALQLSPSALSSATAPSSFSKPVAMVQPRKVHHHLFAQTRRRKHDQHENKSRTRKAQKTGAYILPIKRERKKQTRSI